MADLTITAANVAAVSTNRIERKYNAGATITAGQAVVLNSSGVYVLADNNSATAALRVPDGIALNGASSGQPLAVLKGGDVTIGATLTPGLAYYLSDTPGGIGVVGDLSTGEYPCVIGIARSASVLRVNITASGVAL